MTNRYSVFVLTAVALIAAISSYAYFMSPSDATDLANNPPMVHPVEVPPPVVEPIINNTTDLTSNPDRPTPPQEVPTIDIAIALDVSGSMDGLINSARQKMWEIVNESVASQPTPKIRVALITFGHSDYSQGQGFTRVDMPLTEDLDNVYERLMSLRTNGGDEYVARAIRTARTDLNWSNDPKAVKLLFVAGNESADQDPIYRTGDEARLAAAAGIQVNTLLCGENYNSLASGWKNAVKPSDGEFAVIARDGGAVVLNAPQDDKLLELNKRLNKTYLGYGSGGARGKQRQIAMDSSAEGMSKSAAATRVATKGGGAYNNSGWDLLDGVKAGLVDLSTASAEELPAEMPAAPAARKEFVAKKAAERAKIQAEIAELSKEREAFVKKEMKKHKADADKDFGNIVKRSVRKAKKKSGAFGH